MNLEPLKFHKKYRIGSVRLKNHDYGSTGDYFATICTKNKEPWFGEIKNGFMCLSDIGQIVWDEWLKTSVIRPEISLGEFIVMPDHVHGIVEINKHHDWHNGFVIDNRHDLHNGRVETLRATSLHHPRKKPNDCRDDDHFYSHISPKQKSLSSVVRSFKSAVTQKSRTINPSFAWQPRFYDRIIRNQHEYNAITDYIRLNPKNWNREK